MKRLSLQQKMAASLLLPALLLLLGFAGTATLSMQATSRDSQQREALVAARGQATALAGYLQTAISTATNTAALAVARPDLPDADYHRLLEQQLINAPALYGSGVTFVPANRGGARKDLYVHRNEPGFRRMDQSNTYDGTDGSHEWFELPKAAGKPVWTPPYFDEGAGNTWMVTYAVPFYRGQAFDGVALTDVRLEYVGRTLASGIEGGNWLLLDSAGRVLWSPDARHIGRPYTDWAPAGTERAGFISAALAGDEARAAVFDWGNGSALLTGAARIEPLGWMVVIGQPPATLGPGGFLLEWFFVMLLIGFITLYLLSRLLQRQIAPITSLTEKVRQLEASSNTPVADAGVEPGDEVAALSDGLDRLGRQLARREQHLMQRQRELADRVREQQVLYQVADTLGWTDIGFARMVDRVTALLPEAWPSPEQVNCRINLAEYRSVSEGFAEGPRGLFAPIEVDGGGGGVWVFALDAASAMEAGQQELLEGVAQQLSLAYRRERTQQQLEKLNRELEQRVELRTEALRNAERLLRDITNSMPGAVYQVVQRPPKPAELRFVSAGIEAVYGVPRDRALASYESVMSLVFPEDLSALSAVIANAIGRRIAYSHVHRITHGESGQVRWIRTAANTLTESDGSVLLNGYWIDVTDQKELELQLETARREADAASEAKSRFLANMSHEIRTPMNAIIGLTHLAAKQTREAKVRDQLTRVEDSARALLGLLNDILDFSKIEAGRMTVERIPFDLWNLLDRVQSLMADRAREKGLLFDVWRVPSLPRDLMGDPLRLHQVLLNLVSNAVKFTPKGSVTINCTVEPDEGARSRLRFEVRDTGVGIDPIQMTRLFSAFTQADNSTTRRFGGTGLGLTICKELASLMGGRITVDSTPGVGSTFTLLLALDHADPAWRLDGEHAAADEASDPLDGANVLLVDDNFINLEVAGELLRQAKVTVTTASNGREALEKIMAFDYDAVLMDLQMPELDGLTATRRLRLDPRHANLPVIAMTANAMAGDRERCLEAGMNDHIPKPIDPDELRRTLGRWLRRSARGDLEQTIPPPLL